mgnify:FL=1
MRNTGARAGHHTVDLFVSDLYASLSPAARRLRGFDKLHLDPGESRRIVFELGEEDLSFVNTALQRVVEPGEFRVQVGNLSANFRFEEN